MITVPYRLRRFFQWMLGKPNEQPFIRGIDVFKELSNAYPKWTPRVIFDVGANVGQSCLHYARLFPGVSIHAFEPGESAYATLAAACAVHPQIKVHNIGLGDKSAVARLSAKSASDQNTIVQSSADSDINTTTIQLATLDEFCKDKQIESIDYLKIDTEGYDLNVLRGAVNLLRKSAISVIEVEAGINPDNTLHVPFHQFCAYLEPMNYRIFGIYEQMHEWPTRQPHLRRCNPVFVSPNQLNLSGSK